MDEAVAYARRARGEHRRPSTGWDSLSSTSSPSSESRRVPSWQPKPPGGAWQPVPSAQPRPSV
jgi:hypothetical protein